ncbi:MAG TPA: hypothetical protein VMR62_31345 [Bryobacteraceae bacterium]|jgi:uncharacterized protein (TIGR03437 family)|nr:hypothetical protein [Bryobacteraceae bacterium]
MRSLIAYLYLALTLTVLASAQIVLDPSPARVSGHPPVSPPEQLLISNVNPNFGANGGMYYPEGAAVDTSGSAPILYVADYANNRVLGWKNATSSTLANLQAPDVIIGQPNAYTTLPSINGGLSFPAALLADPSGNLYVADVGNNRVLRYPAPVTNSTTPDIVLGQPDRFTSVKANQGGTLSATTICFSGACPAGSASGYFISMAMDSSGNLFLADAGNRRVLRYPAASLTSGASDPAADLVIGQSSFTVVNSPTGATDKNTLAVPAGLAFDSAGHLFVTDSFSRLIVYPSQVSSAQAGNGIAAIRFAGVLSAQPSTATASTLYNPQGIVMINNGPAVMDSGDNRLLIFDAFSSTDWTIASGDTTLANPPPVAIAVMGQGTSLTNFTSVSVNAGNPQASFTSNGAKIATFNSPATAAVTPNGDLFVVDTYNHRILVYPTAGQVAAATEVLGQSDFPYNSPNSIHGSEFYFGSASSSSYDAGIAVDSSGSTPHLYVSDPNNNRILGFADARKVGPGVQADLVIGEPDLMTALCNFGGVTNPVTEALPRQPTQSSLCHPTGLAVDPASGDLYVADSSNGRVLRFPAPFAPANSSLQANLVLGQTAFTGISNPQASQSIMIFPYGLVFDPQRGLLVSDEAANRVLLFPINSGTTNGEAATAVIGQSSYSSTSSTVLSSPHHIAEDSIAEIYVADSGHNQILVFGFPTGTSAQTPVNSITGLSYPEAVWVNPNTVAGYHDDIWVGDSGLSISRYPVLNPLVTNNTPSLYMAAAEVAGPSLSCSLGLCGYPAIAITQDSNGALYVADATNRVAIHYPALAGQNGASFVCAMGCALGGLNDQPFYLAPGAFASLYLFNGLTFASSATTNYSLPVPTTLGGLQVLVNNTASPVTNVLTNQINFVVPFEAPSSGTAQVVVVNSSTSQVLGSGSMSMNTAAPGFFTTNQQGTGQIAALNCNQTPCENTLNGAKNPVSQGKYIQFFLTGQGAVAGVPPDGHLPSGTVNTAPPVVYIGSAQATVAFSGLAPCCVGLWQINVQIPSSLDLGGFGNFAAGVFPVLIDYNGITSNTPANNGNPYVATTIVVNAPE